MAPVRRYLRITKYSVLECRIYVDNPALVQSWLLHPRDPVLPRVMESVRPLVLPKLMEERDRTRKKGTSKKNKGAIRDVLVEKDFEVSLFLIETNTRHSLLYKHRRARDKTQTRLVSNSSRLTGGETTDAPIDVDAHLGVELPDNGDGDGDGDDEIVLMAASTGLARAPGAGAPPPPNLLLEDSDDEGGSGRAALQHIPDIHEDQDDDDDDVDTQRRSKRRRNASNPVHVDDSDDDDDDGSLFGADGSGHDDDSIVDVDADDGQPPKKKKRTRVVPATEGDMPGDGDDEGGRKKKKLAMDVIYEGFAIYGRVLCLVVKQRGAPPRGRSIRSMLPSPAATGSTAASSSADTAAQTPTKPAGQAAMVNWIASTQVPMGDSADEG